MIFFFVFSQIIVFILEIDFLAFCPCFFAPGNVFVAVLLFNVLISWISFRVHWVLNKTNHTRIFLPHQLPFGVDGGRILWLSFFQDIPRNSKNPFNRVICIIWTIPLKNFSKDWQPWTHLPIPQRWTRPLLLQLAGVISLIQL